MRVSFDTVEPGDQFGEYVIRRQLGQGGQGAVYEVEDRLGCFWALKIGHRLHLEDPLAEARFVKEAQWVSAALNKLPRNAGVLVGEHYGVHDSRYYVKMRLLEGESLAARLARVGAQPEADAIGIAAAVADAVSIAHRHEALHRDLKPENVFIESDGNVQVLDWGCLQLMEAGRAGETESGPMCTLGYAALEQYKRPLRLGPETDVYSLGVMLLEMLTGVHPFLGWSRKRRSSAVPVSGLPSTVVFGNLATGLADVAPATLPADASPSSMATVRRSDAPLTDDALRGEVATRDTPRTERLDSSLWGTGAGSDNCIAAATRTAGSVPPINSPGAATSFADVLQRQRTLVLDERAGIGADMTKLLSEMVEKSAARRISNMAVVAERLRRLQRSCPNNALFARLLRETRRPTLMIALGGALIGGTSMISRDPPDGPLDETTSSPARANSGSPPQAASIAHPEQAEPVPTSVAKSAPDAAQPEASGAEPLANEIAPGVAQRRHSAPDTRAEIRARGDQRPAPNREHSQQAAANSLAGSGEPAPARQKAPRSPRNRDKKVQPRPAPIYGRFE